MSYAQSRFSLGKMPFAALTPCRDVGFRPRKAGACVRQDQTDIAWLHLTGLDSPEIDGEQARAGHNGFLSGSRSGFDSGSQNMMELLKSAPASIPLVKTPDGLHKHAAQALVAHAINGAQSSRVCAGVFARTAADKAAAFFCCHRTSRAFGRECARRARARQALR